MAEFDTIRFIDEFDEEYVFPRPVNFAPMRENVYASEYTTMNGTYKADLIGWKYADMELTWEALRQSDVYNLVTMLGSDSGLFKIVFDDADASYASQYTLKKEDVRRISTVSMRHRYKQYGEYYFRNVSFKISFVKTHLNYN